MSWNTEDKEGFVECSSKHIGQINLGTRMGDLIYNLVLSGEFKIVYDIGCWNGEGTTKCIVSALHSRPRQGSVSGAPDTEVYGFEVNLDKYAHTKELYKNHENVHIVHGSPRVTNITFEDILKVFPELEHREQEKYWCNIDLENSSSAQNFEPHSQIDLVVHDGGEWDSWFIYQDLKSKKVKNWILDDTNTDKNKLVFFDLKADPKYELITHEPNDRNGWAHFKLREE